MQYFQCLLHWCDEHFFSEKVEFLILLLESIITFFRRSDVELIAACSSADVESIATCSSADAEPIAACSSSIFGLNCLIHKTKMQICEKKIVTHYKFYINIL